MQILIYQDYVHNNGALFRALSDHAAGARIGFCDAADIQEGCLDHTVRLFVMPGGADLFYAEKLNGAGNRAIRDWVERGGVYLGLCAGAYYACRTISWCRDDAENAITGARELGFFPGEAVGPLPDFIEDSDHRKSWQAAPTLLYDDGSKRIECPAFYEAGPVFIPDEGSAGYKVIGQYTGLPGQPAAIVECPAGRGKAVLCSPHLEWGPYELSRRFYQHRNSSPRWQEKVAQALAPHRAQGQALWAALLDRCLSGTRGEEKDAA